MRVNELIDILSDHPGDAVVELSIIAPVNEGDDDITVDRYFIDGVHALGGRRRRQDDDDAGLVWLVGGEDADVDVFLDAIEVDTD